MRLLTHLASTAAGLRLKPLLAVSAAMLLTACATPKAPYDYTAFKAARPASILVLPPVNESPDVKATSGAMASTMLPLSEAGYYVFPVSLVDETFKQNGMTVAEDIHQLPADKLRSIFGADAALYMRVKRYGSSYYVINSETVVTVEGKVVDLRTGTTLWQGTATASSAEGGNSGGGGLAGALVGAIVKQVLSSTTESGFTYAALANQRLLGAPYANGILFGPRSPRYQKD
jgi:hypothetical protein